MADFDAKIVIKLGVKQAKSAMRGMSRDRRRAARRRNTAVSRRNTIGRRMRTLVGGVAGFSAVSRITRTSADTVDPWAETLIPFEAAFQEFVTNTVGFSAAAVKRARADTVQRYAPTVVEMRSMGVASEYFDTALGFISEEEEGRNILRQDPNFRSPSIADLLAQAVPGYVALVRKSIGYILEGMKQ